MGFHYLLTYTFFTIFRQACEINTVSYAARDSARAETLIDEKCIQKGEAILSGKKKWAAVFSAQCDSLSKYALEKF